MAVSLKGVFLGLKYGVASVLCTGGGSVVNTASAAGLVGWTPPRPFTFYYFYRIK